MPAAPTSPRRRALVLVKHSLPAMDRARPAREWSLSEQGRRRAERLADRLSAVAPGTIVTSPEAKARETADIVAARLGIPAEADPDFREQERDNEPLTAPDEFRTRMAAFFADPDRVVFGTESARHARFRFTRGVAELLARHPSGNLVVVSHGTVITLFVAACTGLDAFPFWRRLGLPGFVELALPELTLRHVEWSVTAEEQGLE
jgi:broad specificity phosphatase PhoE